MAVIFDEVVGEVSAERSVETADKTATAQSAAGCDPLDLRRELARIAVRKARLFAD